MKLRFEVDQAECFRKGIDCPKSIVTIEVDPAKIPADERNLIADRLGGIDVLETFAMPAMSEDGLVLNGDKWAVARMVDKRIKAEEPTYKALIKAVRENDKATKESLVAQEAKLKTAKSKAAALRAEVESK